jgi:16S rRNA (guanine966-N2)-methyltransferase
VTRIIAGSAGGRRLTVPPSAATRPTSDRAREGLFSSLESLLAGYGRSLAGSRVLDLYAGSGALGLEALSRGADTVVCVESDARAAAVIRRNAEQLGLHGAQVVCDRVERLVDRELKDEPDAPFDVVLADPPYAMPAEAIDAVLRALVKGSWLADGAIVVVERATRDDALTWPPGFDALRERRYGEATLWYGLWYGRAGSVNGSLSGQGA